MNLNQLLKDIQKIDEKELPKRNPDGTIDMEWWNNLPLEERYKYDVWVSEITKEKNSPQEIIIKPEALDTSVLDNSSEDHSVWRPTSFNEYIGQSSLKEILKGYIKGCKKLNKPFPHMLIDGKAGMGKTTIAYLIAKMLNKPFVETVATTLKSEQQFVDKLAECQGGILFLDEIHMINKRVANFILPILEDFQVNGKRIKPFSLFCCTTEKGSLLRKFKPLIDRMKIQKTLEDYTEAELTILTKQYAKKTFPDNIINDDIFEQIAKNCRGTPRIAIRYIESFIYMGLNIEEIFKMYGIVKDGLTKEDIKVLELLNEKEKGVGIKAMSAFLGTSEENYSYQIEGYLIQKGYITITSRRQITEKGKNFLKEINYV